MKTMQLFLAGADHYREDILKIVKKNPNTGSGKREYSFYPLDCDAELIPEPENVADKNAVKVMAKGVKVGYIPAENAEAIKGFLKSGMITGCRVKILGGNYFENGQEHPGTIHGDVYISIKDINIVLLIACILGGWIGLHRFMMKDWKWGIIYAFTGGLFMIGWIVDVIKILTGKMK